MGENASTAPLPACGLADPVRIERQRMEALDRLDILDTPAEEAFDRITRLTQKLLQVPFVIVTMIDGHRAWSKSIQGMDFAEGPRELSFCKHTILQDGPLIVPDATADPRFACNPYVTAEPFVRFYAGIPLSTRDGHNVGTLCAVDTKPREFTAEQIEILSDFARMAMDELELRMLAPTDSLTGALSRRAFKEEAVRAAALASRHRHELSCIALHLDRFKSITGDHGNPAGDIVLTKAVSACLAELRKTDIMGRLGGEDFAVLLPHTPRRDAAEVAEKLRAAIERMTFVFESRSVAVTASLGVASLDAVAKDADTLLQRADQALQEAKENGRNRVRVWRTAEDEPLAKPGRRVFKGGQIVFNGRTSIVDCTVRSLSEEGASLDVHSSAGVPKSFQLAIRSDDFEKSCRILTRTEKRIEVAFC